MNEYGHIPTRDSTEKRQRERLGAMLATVLSNNPFYRAKFSTTRFNPAVDPLSVLPFTTREELERDQAAHPPYGTNLTFSLERYTRLHQTSGTNGTPLRWLDTPDSWNWWKNCWNLIYDAAGLTPSDRLVFPFSFGPFIGFWSAFESALARGNFVLAAGGMTTVARLRYLLENRATIVCCTPTYALHMAEIAANERIDLPNSQVRALVVAGEPGGNVPGTRAAIEKAWGARVFDHAGMTEMGAWGFESVQSPGGLFVNECEFIAECVEPKGNAAGPEGEIGELVLTNLGRVGSPLIRYRTGDLVRLVPRVGRGGCESNFSRCEGGLLGRVDEMLIVRGNNVFPTAIESILRSVPGVAEFRMIAEKRGMLDDLRIEVERAATVDAESLGKAVVRILQDRLNFRCDVRIVEPGTLPRFEMKAIRIVKT